MNFLDRLLLRGRDKKRDSDFSPSVAIGSLSFGGAMKTPVTLAVSEALARKHGGTGWVLTRGYRGKIKTGILKKSLPRPEDAELFGDEACLHARAGWVVVKSANRLEGLKLAEEKLRQKPAWVVLDDGLQTTSFRADKRIIILDPSWPEATRKFWLGGGKFRDTPQLLSCVDLVAWVSPPSEEDLRWVRGLTDAPQVVVPPAHYHLSEPVREAHVAVGIARPERVRKVLEDLGVKILSFASVPDHRKVSIQNFPTIVTEKDAVKMDMKPGIIILHQKINLNGLWDEFLP